MGHYCCNSRFLVHWKQHYCNRSKILEHYPHIPVELSKFPLEPRVFCKWGYMGSVLTASAVISSQECVLSSTLCPRSFRKCAFIARKPILPNSILSISWRSKGCDTHPALCPRCFEAYHSNWTTCFTDFFTFFIHISHL